MAAEAKIDRYRIGGIELREDVSIQEFGAFFDAVLGLVGERGAGGVAGFQIAKVVAAGKTAEVTVAQFEVVRTLEQL